MEKINNYNYVGFDDVIEMIHLQYKDNTWKSTTRQKHANFCTRGLKYCKKAMQLKQLTLLLLTFSCCPSKHKVQFPQNKAELYKRNSKWAVNDS